MRLQTGKSQTPCKIESLESRQLLSRIIDVRLVGGGKAANVSSVGQVIQMEVFATVTGADANGANDGLQMVVGSFLSSNLSGGTALGTLEAAPVAPFDALVSTSGTQADLDGDGDLDIGSNDTA